MTDKKKPGRPRKEPRRRRRNIGSHRFKLSAPKIDGYETRWVNDYRNRIHEFNVDDDWDFVTREEVTKDGRVDVGDPDINNVIQPGEKVCVPVGMYEGQPLNAYLMKKKQEYFNEDFKAAQKRIDEQEKDLYRRTNIEEQRGTLDINKQ